MSGVRDERRAPALRGLVEKGLLRPEAVAEMGPVAERYAVGITPAMMALIDPADPDDPIARQFVPRAEELNTRPGERADPIGDRAHEPVPGLVHRHPDRVLLLVHHACPVYCRFCFRREVVGPGGAALTGPSLEAALAYIAAHEEIWEVILTGGDPFLLSPERARALGERLSAIPHVRVIRWHTRVPVVEPERVSAAFARALCLPDRAVYVALHANHPREMTQAARAALDRLRACGVTLVSQSVLLRGVNDDVETLAALMRAFVEAGVKPYYLHHPDLAPGTGHFRLSIAEGQRLMAELRARVSGLCLPSYVLDIPGGYGKVPLVESAWDGEGVRDARGTKHNY